MKAVTLLHKNQLVQKLCGFIIICAAIAVGAWSGVALCEWLEPLPQDAEIRHAHMQEVKRAPAPEDAARLSTLSRARHGWIADVWSGPRRTGAFKVAGVTAAGTAETESVDSRTARNGFSALLRRALRKRGKAPLEERYARRAKNPFNTPEARRRSHGAGGDDDETKGPVIYPGDVYISGLPMIDQGNRPYCAVASAARVLQGYGIEVTMEDLVTLAKTSEMCGTSRCLWENAIRQVAEAHGLELTVIPELTEIKTPLPRLIYDYNLTAHSLGYQELDKWDYLYGNVIDYKSFAEDREYPVQREVMLSSNIKCSAFDDNVTSRIDESDPIFWTVTLGDVPEQSSHGNDTYLSADRGAHMRLIIGYNEERGEVLYSDSWGEGHELKRMDASDALSITTGMYYLKDSGGKVGVGDMGVTVHAYPGFSISD